MDLNHLTHGEHKHFIHNSTGTLEDLVANISAQNNPQDDNSVPLFKIIKQSDSEYTSFIPKSFCVKSEQYDESTATEPEQFARFIQFIKSVPDKTHKAEISMFLFPVFIHSYLEMLDKSITKEAYEFAEKYMKLFSKNKDHSQLVEELVNIKFYKDIVNSQKLRYFRENRYSLKISESTFSVLETFFTQEVNFPFLELIQSKIDLTISDIRDLDDGPEVEHGDSDTERSHTNKRMKDGNDFKVNYESIPEYKRFLDAKKNLENVPPRPQRVMCWAIHNLEEASCAEINSDGTFMLVGSLSGRIMLSKHAKSPMINDLVTVPINSVPLATPGMESPTVRHMKRFDSMYMNVYGNKGAVHDVSFVPDSKYFLSVSSDNYMRAYSLDTYNCVMKYSGHDMTIWSVEACNKGLAVTGSRDSTARLWSLEHLYPLRILVGHKQDVTCARFHPKATYIGTGSYDKAVRLWSITDGSSVRVFADHDSPVLSIGFSPCGKFLASGGNTLFILPGEDGSILIHDLTKGQVIFRTFISSIEPVTSLAWSVTGETIVAASTAGTIQMYAWPSVNKIGALEPVNTVTYQNAMERILNVQYKKYPPGQPLCLGVMKDIEQDTFVVKEETSSAHT